MDPSKRAPAASTGRGQVFLGTGGDAPVRSTRPDQLSHVYRLNDPTLSELALEPLLEEILARIREILSVDTAAILLVDDEAKSLIARAANGLEEEVEQGVRIPLGKGFAGRIASERLPIFIAEVRDADVVNPILLEKGIRSMLGVPLIVEAHLLGVLHVGSLTPRTFTNEDAAVLQLAAARIAPAIERARLFEALEREHRGAVMLQRSLLPERLPEIAGVPVATGYFPARDEVGGDWYDVLELPNGKVGIAIGDVAGHGVRAAALMGQLRTALRAYALEGYGPGVVLEQLDRFLHSIRTRGMATAIYAVFDPQDATVRFAVAGHLPPAIIEPGGEGRLLTVAPGQPLGALDYAIYEEGEIELGEGHLFALYTDGLVELRGESIDAGLDRLIEAIRGATSPDQVGRQIVDAMVPREGSEDDVAFVVLQNEAVDDELLLRLPASPTVLVQVRQKLRPWLRARGATPEEVEQITLACGEACANAIEHAYPLEPAILAVEVRAQDGEVVVVVRDAGTWRAPRGENRGRGLAIMRSLMESVDISSNAQGTEVLLRRRLSTPR